MLIGVLCEIVTTVAASEKERASVNMVKDTLLVMLRAFDADGSGTISKDELIDVFVSDEALICLDNLNVDAVRLMEYLDMGESHLIRSFRFDTNGSPETPA